MKRTPDIVAVQNPFTETDAYDALVLVYSSPEALHAILDRHASEILGHVQTWAPMDKAFYQTPQFMAIQHGPHARVILAPCGPLNRDHDDVRQFHEATRLAVRRAKAAGALRPLLLLAVHQHTLQQAMYTQAPMVTLLAALQECYEPLEAVEWSRKTGASLNMTECLGFSCTVVDAVATTCSFMDVGSLVQQVAAMEAGRLVARDICGSDPERMTALKAAEYIRLSFKDAPNITVECITNTEVLRREYPLFAAVARASLAVPRHAPAMVKISYRSPEPSKVSENLHFVGKGVTYDTGGADVKTGGHMRGMSRDKGGAAGVAGFMKTLSLLQPHHVNATAYLAFVRNSIGSDSYVSDEIIVSRAGVRVLVGNTDAEGRMAMADVLGEAAMEAQKEQVQFPHVKSRLFTVATLTGHVIRAYGPYPACMDNGPARQMKTSQHLAASGEQVGEPWEISTLRREDFGSIIKATSSREDVVQCNTAPSTMTSRGHQFPAAFMSVASGLDRLGLNQEDQKKQVAYTHLDIAGATEEEGGASGSLPQCTGAPVVSLTAAFLLH